jgi:hypothetical protein
MYDLEGFAERALPDTFFEVAGFFLQSEVARVGRVSGEVQDFYFVWHYLYLHTTGVFSLDGYSAN